MFPDTICYKNPCSNPGFKAKKNLTIKIWEIRLIRNSYSLSITNMYNVHLFVQLHFDLQADKIVSALPPVGRFMPSVPS